MIQRMQQMPGFVGLLSVPSHLLEHSVCGTLDPAWESRGRGQATLLLVIRENRFRDMFPR